jgi:hypothetical protein
VSSGPGARTRDQIEREHRIGVAVPTSSPNSARPSVARAVGVASACSFAQRLPALGLRRRQLGGALRLVVGAHVVAGDEVDLGRQRRRLRAQRHRDVAVDRQPLSITSARSRSPASASASASASR